jgi:hypothetical protein
MSISTLGRGSVWSLAGIDGGGGHEVGVQRVLADHVLSARARQPEHGEGRVLVQAHDGHAVGALLLDVPPVRHPPPARVHLLHLSMCTRHHHQPINVPTVVAQEKEP